METEWIYYIPAVVLVALLAVSWTIHKTYNHPSFVITSLYALSSVVGVFVNRDTLPTFNFAHTWEMLAGYTLLVGLGILPSFLIKKISPPDLNGNELIMRILHLILPLAWFAFVYQVPFASKSLSSGAEAIRDMLNTEDYNPMPVNLVSTVATAISQFYPAYALAFMEGIVKKRNILYVASCFIGLACVVVNSFCFTARDGVLWFMMSIWISYWIYKPAMKKKDTAVVRRIFLAGASFAVLVLGTFTFQRFFYSKAGVFDSVLTYIGQQPYVFAETVAEQGEFYGLNLRFPLIAEWAGTYQPIKRLSVYEWTFGGFAKDFYAVNGWITAFLMTGAMSAFFCLAFRFASKINHISASLLLLLYFQILTQGVFYFRLGIRAGNYWILMVVVLALVIQIAYPIKRQAPTATRGHSV